MHYSRLNIILGWLSFAIALVVYTLTLEPTVSWWDCGEFIACSYKLLVGHPPGAPLFLLMGRIFTLLTSDPEKVAMMVNFMSALASAFTILFLFWTITHLAKKMVDEGDPESASNRWKVFGAGLTGALAYTFSDSFWFSAVEGEVYATSSLFTAVVFWAILKWENIADEKHADRWLILIAYLMGLSIGIHLLNLLAIPAIVLVYYYRRYTFSRAGLLKALGVSVLLLGVIMYGIIQGLVLMASKFELLFVNGLGMGFNSGVIIYSVLVIGFVVFGIAYTRKKGLVMWNSVLTGLAVILIGYSSYATIVIRSLANPPMDMNDPQNVFSLLSYLNREQYGDRPLVTGHNFTDEIKRDAQGYAVIEYNKPVYRMDSLTGKYIVSNRKPELLYADRKTLFPRMYSSEPDHITEYREWTNLEEGEDVETAHNLQFFVNYQLGFMYFRYFMWNFVGRQNDIHSQGSMMEGNWLSGIKFIDELRLGDQDDLPDRFRNMESRNTYYFFPFLLGLLGLLFHYSRDKKGFWVTMMLFLFTGIAIVIYLNQTPNQPRERDYAFVGSFYAFSIWIGLGIPGIADAFRKYEKSRLMLPLVVIISLLAVPGLMAYENWDDHDRSGRYTARDIARNYLNTCEKDAIIFTNGDNDTYPLWYVQEVEGIRTDVRVVNTMLINSEWNIRQIMQKAYESEPLPLTLPMEQYIDGVNNSFFVIEDPENRRVRLQTIMEGIKTGNRLFSQKTRMGDEVTVIPTNHLILPADSAIVFGLGIVDREDAEEYTDPLLWSLSGGQMLKSNLVTLDILSSFNWERPVYFVAGGNDGAMNMEKFFQLEGLAFRIVPIETPGRNFFTYGRIEPEILDKHLMEDFTWGRMNEKDVYLDHYNLRTLSVIRFRKNYVRLANAWLEEGDTIRAEEVLDRCMDLSPHSKIPYDYFVSGISYPDQNNNIIRNTGVIESYYRCGAIEKGNALMLEFMAILEQDFLYYQKLKTRHKPRFAQEFMQSRNMYEEMVKIAGEYGQSEFLRRNVVGIYD